MPYFTELGIRRYYCEEQELLDIANKIRAAGGAEALEAFFPSDIGQEKSCLIANALNFGCKVSGFFPKIVQDGNIMFRPAYDGDPAWTMQVPTAKLAKQLAAELGWEVINVPSYRNFIILPQKVGNTAAAFDERKGWTKKYGRTD